MGGEKEMKFIFFIILAFLLINPCFAWNITVNQTGESFIAWNVSDRPAAITYLAYDGHNLTDYDPYANILIQSGLGSGETHIITATSFNQTVTQSATTNISVKNQFFFTSSITWDFFNQWFYLGLIIILFILGAKINWAFYLIGSFISLFALAKWLVSNPDTVTDIWHLQFYIYAALFILGLLLWLLQIRKRKR